MSRNYFLLNATDNIALGRLAGRQSDNARRDRLHDALVLGAVVVPVVDVGDAVLVVMVQQPIHGLAPEAHARDRRSERAAQVVRRGVWQVAKDPPHGAIEFADTCEDRSGITAANQLLDRSR